MIGNTGKTTSNPRFASRSIDHEKSPAAVGLNKLFLFRRFAGALFIDNAGLDCFGRSSVKLYVRKCGGFRTPALGVRGTVTHRVGIRNPSQFQTSPTVVYLRLISLLGAN
jgi:hypothetical protein